MNANKRPHTPKNADVVRLADFRTGERPQQEDARRSYANRIELVATNVISRLNDKQNPAVAAATAYITADGTVGTAAAGIEPVMAAVLASELRSLTALLDRHASTPPRTRNRRRQRGSGIAILISAVGFIAATYINDVAWIDAVLSLAAQIVAAMLSSRLPR